jgi:hypothetical protein
MLDGVAQRPMCTCRTVRWTQVGIARTHHQFEGPATRESNGGEVAHVVLRGVVAFQDAHRAFFDPRTLRRERLTVADYDRFPVFTFEDEPLADQLGRTLIGLTLWTAALFARIFRASSQA